MAGDPRPSYPYGLAMINVIFIGLGLGAVLDPIDTELRHKLTGSAALVITGAAHWYFTRRSGHPIWNAASDFAGGTLRGRTTTLSVAADAVLLPLLFVVA